MRPDQLRAIRKGERLDLTQAQLGERLGYGQTQIIAFERGKAPIPTVVALAVLALEAGLSDSDEPAGAGEPPG